MQIFFGYTIKIGPMVSLFWRRNNYVGHMPSFNCHDRYLEERRRKLKSRRRGAGEKEVLEREEEEGEGEDAQLTRTKPPMDFSDLKGL